MKDELAIMWEQSKTALETERTKLLAELSVHISFPLRISLKGAT